MKIKGLFNFRAMTHSLSDIYSTKNDEAKGRLISLGSALTAAFYNVFITGIFYTGFLSMYDISITGVGIVSFIPYIASCFSIFSSSILERIKKRKAVLLAAKIYFYFMYIVATTLMPQFVTDPDARLICLIVILFLAYSVYALFSPGLTTWFYKFYPEDNERRTKYIVLNQIFASIMSSCILLLSGVLTDAVAGSAFQDQLILGLRYAAFVMVLVDVFMQAQAKEYPYPEGPKLNLMQIFTLPFKYRKFLLCMLFMFSWNFIANLNNGLWNYHLLNHLDFTYTLINTVSIMYTVILLCTQSIWKRILRRYSWIKTFGIAVLIFVPTEAIMFSLQPGMWVTFLCAAFVQNLVSVGLNFSYSNVLYMNLPEENSTAHIAFHTIGCNVFAFLGMITGTYVSSITGDNTMPLLGMDVYSVQFTTLMRGVLMLIMGIILVRFWRHFTRDQDIAEVDEQAAMYRRLREKRKHMPSRWRLPWRKRG